MKYNNRIHTSNYKFQPVVIEKSIKHEDIKRLNNVHKRHLHKEYNLMPASLESRVIQRNKTKYLRCF